MRIGGLCELSVRPYRFSDLQEIAYLFYDTITSVNIKDYSLSQINAWANTEIDTELWHKSLSKNHSFVVLAGHKIVGFADMEQYPSFYIDRLFVHKDYQRCGVGTLLMNTLNQCIKKDVHQAIIHTLQVSKTNNHSVNFEQETSILHRSYITASAHVSLTAKNFFEAFGFEAQSYQVAYRNKVALPCWSMQKEIPLQIAESILTDVSATQTNNIANTPRHFIKNKNPISPLDLIQSDQAQFANLNSFKSMHNFKIAKAS